MKRFLTLLLLTGLLAIAMGQSAIDYSLFELPDVIFKKIEAPKGYADAFELKVKQPIDHKNPSKGYFYQRAFLSHKSLDRPTVLITEGYARSSNRIYEVTQLLEANQLMVEHRYFGISVPDSLDYRFLNLEQATADLHKINVSQRRKPSCPAPLAAPSLQRKAEK